MDIRLRVRGRKNLVRFVNVISIRYSDNIITFTYTNIANERKIASFPMFDILEFYIKEN